MIGLTINGLNVEVEEGTTILEAAEKLGIEIPRLCHHPLLSPNGSCRMCVVEVEGFRNLPASCSTPAADQMKVLTESERVVRARRTILDLMLANHPADCLTCEKNGDCRLQDYAYRYGVKGTSFSGARREYETDKNNPFLERDHGKCILCGRCIQVCAERVGSRVFDFGYRGFETKIVSGLDQGQEESNCVFCGNCVTLCPVGALQPKPEKGKGRSYEIRKVRSVCAYCGVGCAVNLHVNKGKIVGVSPAGGPADDGLLCVKGRFGWDYLQHPDRLTRPLLRKNGELSASTWEEALRFTAHKLLEIKEKYGPDAVGAISSAKCSNEENYLLQKMMRAAVGTNNVDNSARLCHASTIVGLFESFGSGAATSSLAGLDRADLFFVIGSNTPETHPVIAFRLLRAQNKGARLIVADPRRTELAEKADLFLQHLPGSDVALLNGLLHVIIRDGLYDREFIEKRTEGFAGLWSVLEKYSPAYVERITGVAAADVERAAALYAAAPSAAILYAMGITQHTTGTDNVQNIANLAMVCGNVGRENAGVYPLRGQNNVQGSCDMGALPGYYPGYRRVDSEEARAALEKAWGVKLPALSGLTVTEMIDSAAAGRLKALYVMGENPMMSNPDLNHVEKGLRNLEFLVVQDIFLSETARLADVVFPAAAVAEKEGTFTNTERRVQLFHRAVDPAGESLPDWEIISRLSTLLGFPMDYRSAGEIMAEIAAVTPQYGGIAYDRLGENGLQWPCPDREHPGTSYLHKDRFTRGLGRFRPVEYRPPAEIPDERYPFIFVTGRHLYHYHTGTMSRRSCGLETARPEAYAEINPAAAAKLAVEDGDYIRLASRRGEIRIKALVTDRVPEKVIFVPFHYREAAANILTSTASDALSGIPELKVCAVSAEPVKGGRIG
ncbi:MAG: formate dehydrogenase subunit alpha [Peptococcaceae bacterium]|jgi:formate dehydrogenase alpha subunit|nr:formate dehydrogenase subunit alpha [Peptococcaceae bacterium]MDH7524494.1 formate dehydrogenase subunit alpha [Peptococcaceae bacterium]